MDLVMDAAPDVLNHNTETVPRLYRQVRLGARYERSLDMLAYAKSLSPRTPVKSGLMLGLGETLEEVLRRHARPARRSAVDILTLGQYLRPSAEAPAHRALCSDRRIRGTEAVQATIWVSDTWNPARWSAVPTTRRRVFRPAIRRHWGSRVARGPDRHCISWWS